MSKSKDLARRHSAGIAFTYNGQEVTFDEHRFIDVTQMWRAVGSPPNKKPSEWARHSGTREFVQSLADSLRVGIAHLWKSRTGNGVGTTKVHWQIALAYAKYLSPEFHRFVNEAFREWTEERANPDLKVERAVEGYRRKGWDDERIAARIDGIVQRNILTDTLKSRGVDGLGYAICTDAINTEVLGGSAKAIKLAKGLPAKARTRDHLDSVQLAGLGLAEAMASRKIKDGCTHGNGSCCEVCRESGKAVAGAMAQMGYAPAI
jgi:hypothetical protein